MRVTPCLMSLGLSLAALYPQNEQQITLLDGPEFDLIKKCAR